MRKLVCFYLRGREFAAPIDDVRETIELKPITPVFGTPSSVAGITSLRGEIIAVLDPGTLVGLGPSRRDETTRIVIVEPDHRVAGLLVDGLGAIRDVEDEAIVAPPPNLPPRIAQMLRGVVSLPEHPLGVIDSGRLLGAPELLPFAAESGEDT